MGTRLIVDSGATDTVAITGREVQLGTDHVVCVNEPLTAQPRTLGAAQSGTILILSEER